MGRPGPTAILPLFLGVLSFVSIAGNFGTLLVALLRRRQTSIIPFVGGVAGALALLVCPLSGA